VDPIPIGVFLDYAEWFRLAKSIQVLDELVADLTRSDGRFEATLAAGERVVADAVLAAPGVWVSPKIVKGSVMPLLVGQR